jgi:hypothetical protein
MGQALGLQQRQKGIIGRRGSRTREGPHIKISRVPAPQEIDEVCRREDRRILRLRQSTPFTGSLTPEERSLVFSQNLKERPPE